MKIVARIIIILLALTVLSVAISFFIPGRLSFVDNYSISIEKAFISLLDKTASRSNLKAKQADPYTAQAVSYSELTPYLDEINPGTLFFSDHGRTVSGMFISGTWKHCGIFIGSLDQISRYWGEEHEVVRSLREYYTSEDEYLIFDSSYEKGVAIHGIHEIAELSESSTLRELLLVEYKLSKDEWSQLLLKGEEHLGKDYDYCFVLENDDALYCSEFLYKMLPGEQDKFVPSRKILGREFLLPSDLVQGIMEKGLEAGAFIHKGTISKSDGQIRPLSMK